MINPLGSTDLTDGIAFCALLLALLSYFKTRGLTEKQNSLTEEQTTLAKRMLSIEAGRERERKTHGNSARVEARFGKGAPSRLVLHNKGASAAHKIQITINGHPPGPDNGWVLGKTQSIPEDLDPGASCPLTWFTSSNSRARRHIVVTWEDATGATDQHWEDARRMVTLRTFQGAPHSCT